MKAFLAIAILELFAVHLLASLWSTALAWVLSAFTILFLGQIALLMQGLRKWPTVINEAGITVRHGRKGALFVPLGQVAGSEDVAFSPEERGRQVFRATVIAHPNLMLRLSAPLCPGRRRIERIAMRLDEPALFQAALGARLNRSRAGALGS